MLATTVFALLPLLLTEALAAPPAITAPIPGYKVVDLEFEVEVFPGQFQNFNGTIQEAHEQATKVNPNFKRWQPQYDPEDDETSLTARDPSRLSYHFDTKSEMAKKVHARTDVNWRNTECNKREFGSAIKEKIEDGIDHLNHLNGSPKNGPGPGACGRVSCSWNSAIWWCNDNKFEFTLPFWMWIAWGAQKIVDTCNLDGGWVAGQQFSRDNWNVIVSQANC